MSNPHSFPPDRPDPLAYRPRRLPENLRIAFIHPDLGIGGAERLVVDAAVSLQRRGHTVEIFTSHHDDGAGGRSFEETRDGTLKVHVLGNSIVPPSLGGRFTIICAILRQLHLSLSFLLASLLYLLSSLPFLSSILLPLNHPFTSSADWSPRRQLAPFDVIVVDQLSASIPLLRWAGLNRVVFYCHFPDLLLSPSRSAHEGEDGQPHYREPFNPAGLLRAVYRIPIDRFEEVTTGEADKILVNSEFTSRVFQRTFPGLGRIPRVVYPCVDVKAYGKEVVAPAEADKWLVDGTPALLSINRYEGKKDISLAVEAFARARSEHPTLRLVVAGGYDPRLEDNVTTLHRLQTLATSLDLSHHTFSPTPLASSLPSSLSTPTISLSTPSSLPQVLFLLNMTTSHKALLLSSSTTSALLYTPSYEHLGIVPLEAMASGLPVLATSSGGPTETLVDDGLATLTTTGLLRVPSAEVWATALKDLLALPEARRKEIGEAGKARTKERFSVEKLGQELEQACKAAAEIGMPILQETGFLKLVAFVTIGSFVFGSGFLAYVAGRS
ncbi:hypothetical protein RQP46_000735 [Phenoliferia psychrophenolica]